jgi:hypothetical protein
MSLPNQPPPLNTAIDVCHRMAHEMWCGQRLHVSEPISGLNSETAIRVRLRNILVSLEMLSEGLVEETYNLLMSIDILRDAPIAVLDTSEAMLRAQFPGRVTNTELLEDAGHSAIGGLSRLIICQSIAARMGVWAVRADALDTAKLAHSVFRLADSAPDVDVEELRRLGALQYRKKEYEEAAACYLSADRTRRGAEGLYKASISLWRIGQDEGALWAIRACLLEDLSQFPSAKWLLKAQIVESRLTSLLSDKAEQSTRSAPFQVDLNYDGSEEDEGTEEEFVVGGELESEIEDDMPTVMIEYSDD